MIPGKKLENILLVCIGNRCRSKIAEEYMLQELCGRGYEASNIPGPDKKVRISSAGVAVGIEGKQFTKELGDNADVIIAMDKTVAYSLSNSFNQPESKVITLEIYDCYDNDIESLVYELDKQLLPIIDLYFPYK